MLPQAIANGRNQNGTIAGKLNGQMAAHTPTGWRMVSVSTAVATFSRMRPCMVCGHGAGGLDHLDRAADLGPGVGEGLAHLAGHGAGDLVLMGLQHLAEAEEPAARARSPSACASPGTPPRAAATAASTSALFGERHAREHLTCGGVPHVELLLGQGRDPRPVDVVSQQPRLGGRRHGLFPFGRCHVLKPVPRPAATVHCVSNGYRFRTLCIHDPGSAATRAPARCRGHRCGRRAPARQRGRLGARVRDTVHLGRAPRRGVPADDRELV